MGRFQANLLFLGAFVMEGYSAHAASIRTLPVPTTTIYPGQAISASQLMERKFKTTANSLEGIATEAGDITGKEARRRLPSGKPILLSSLQPPLAVRRGANSIAVFDDMGLSIATPVTILQDGAAGDVVDARNMATGVLIKVIVLPGGGVKAISQ